MIILTANLTIRLGVARCKYTQYSLQRVTEKLSYSLVCQSPRQLARKMMKGGEKCLSFSNMVLGTEFFIKLSLFSSYIRKIGL